MEQTTDNMDKILARKKGIRKKHLPYVAGGLFVVVCLAWVVFGNHARKLNVERSRITISDVTRGEFNDYIRISGQVLPISTVYLSAVEGGRVEEKLIEEGAMVREGEVIVRLSNPTLTRNILDSEAQLAEKQNFLRNTRVTMEQEKLTLQREKLQLDLDVAQKKRKFGQYERLFAENLVSREEYLLAKESYEFSKDSRNLIMERQKQESIYREAQIMQLEENLRNMRRNMDLVREREENLHVKAPVDGQLGLLNVEIGQSIISGSKIGQVNVLSDYKVEAQIDEHYIDRVRAGLDAAFERQDRNFALRVRKVYPEVRGKQFRADFVFVDERPDNIRAGQTYYINLQLGQPAEAILIPRGSFFHATGGRWIFVLTPDGSRAVRREISIGRQNPGYYEVVAGLDPGEQVVTSGYESYGDVQELILK